MARRSNPTGTFARQPSGYEAFIPAPLPPDPPLTLDEETIALLSQADQAVGRLDGASHMLPNPDLFVAMYVRREAVESSAIEGTQSTLQDVLAFELDPSYQGLPRDVEEVVNYVRAMNYGLDRLSTLPLSLRLLREIHAELMTGVRGHNRDPGEFRKTQNWIGPAGATLRDATFVPPPAPEMLDALANLETFLHHPGTIPALVHAAIAHSQFETIHPFLDGNGRVGRLLIAFMLVHAGVQHRPLLYLSHYLKRHRSTYYDLLMSVRRDGDWLPWIRFFLNGVYWTARDATETAQQIIRLRERDRDALVSSGASLNELRLLDFLFQRPLVNTQLVMETLMVSDVTARKVIGNLVKAGLLEEITGKERYRVYRYARYWKVFTDRADVPTDNDEYDETLSSDILDSLKPGTS